MKYLLVISNISFVVLNAYAQNTLPKPSCENARNEEQCRNLSHALSAATFGASIERGYAASRKFSAADNLIKDNTVTRYRDGRTFLDSTLEKNLGQNIDVDAHVSFEYYLNIEDNKKLHIENQTNEISDLEQEARNQDEAERRALNQTRSVYTTVYDTETDANGNTKSVSRQVYVGEEADPDHAGAERARRRAREIRDSEIPSARKKLAKIKETPASKLELLKVTNEIDANSNAANVKSFLRKMRDSKYELLSMRQIHGTAIRSARKLRGSGWVAAAIAASLAAGAAVEAMTGTGAEYGQRAYDSTTEHFEVVDPMNVAN